MFPTRYGEEDPSGTAGGGDAAGTAGGSDAAGVGTILQAVSGIITGVGDVVYMGRMTESKVFPNVADYQDFFQDNLNDLNELKAYLRKYKRWLADPGNLAPWCSPGAKNPDGTQHAPPNVKACTELYHLKPQVRNPGGHRCGSLGCQCKTNACAYHNPALADNYKAWIEGASGRGWEAGWTNPPHLHGRGVTWRMGYLREAWHYLMTVAPAIPIWNMVNPQEQMSVASSMLTQKNVLSTIFPELDGTMPIDMQDHWWNMITTIANLALPPYRTPESVIPYFVFGFTEEQVRALFPDPVKRRAVFSLRYMVSLQRMYTDQLLAASGATDVYAGTAYGAEIAPAAADAETMRGLIVVAAAEDSPVESGAPSASVNSEIRAKFAAGTMRAIVGDPPNIKAYKRLSDADLARAAQKSMIAGGILRKRQLDAEAAEQAAIDSLDDYIAPNYTPLVVGGLSLLAGAFLRSRRG